MRIFVIAIIIIFNLQAWTKANEIKDFEIEGMSIGDSLLDYANKRTINNSRKYYYKSDKFYTIDLVLDSFKTYYAAQVHLEKDDPKFKIFGLGGAIIFGEPGVYFPESVDKCKKQLNIIEKDLDKIFPKADKQRGKITGQEDYDPEVIRNEVYFILDDGDIYLQCSTWSKEFKEKEYLFDSLRLTMMNIEFSNWINNEAY